MARCGLGLSLEVPFLPATALCLSEASRPRHAFAEIGPSSSNETASSDLLPRPAEPPQYSFSGLATRFLGAQIYPSRPLAASMLTAVPAREVTAVAGTDCLLPSCCALAPSGPKECVGSRDTLRQAQETRENDWLQQPASAGRWRSMDVLFGLTAIRTLQVPSLRTAVAGYARGLARGGAPVPCPLRQKDAPRSGVGSTRPGGFLARGAA